MKHFARKALALGILSAFGVAAHAGTATTTLNANLSTVASCSITADAINYGQVSKASGEPGFRRPINVTLRCPAGTNWAISAPAANTRNVTIGGTAHYIWLYRDAAYTQQLGNVSGQKITGAASDANPFGQTVYMTLSSSYLSLSAPTKSGTFSTSFPLTVEF